MNAPAPADGLLDLYKDAYTKPHGFGQHGPDSEWFGLGCRVGVIDDLWCVKVSHAWALGTEDAFEGSGATMEKAFAEALKKLIEMKGLPPRPKTPREIEDEKFEASVMKSKAEAEAAVKEPDAES